MVHLVIIKELSMLFEKLKIRQAGRGEFSFRAFINGKIDLSHAEAVHNIIESDNSFEKELALNNLSGMLYKKITKLKKSLLKITASLSVQIDYDEGELEEISLDEKEIENLILQLNTLLENYQVKKVYKKRTRTCNIRTCKFREKFAF